MENIRAILERSGLPFDIIHCDPELADTATFSAHYGYAMENNANAIVVKSKTGPELFACCVVLATTRLDVNKCVRKRLGARKASFAGPEEIVRITGMTPGGVTPIGLPANLPLWVDAAVMTRPEIVLGGGGRDTKIVVPPAIFDHIDNVDIVEGLAKPVPPLQD